MTWLDDSREIAKTVATKVHKRYHTYFDVSDVAQELLVWVLKREEKVKEWLDHDVETDEYKMGVRKLAKTLTRYADKYCRRMKAQKLGYEIRDEQYYSPITLAELLPFVWVDVLETKRLDGEKIANTGNPAEGGNYIIQLFDVRKGLLALSEQDRDVLRKKFYEQMSYEDLAEALAVSDTTAHRKVDGAIKRLADALGGPNPWERE
jgi:RNA polymerase sigma factor (sigma-70 family)